MAMSCVIVRVAMFGFLVSACDGPRGVLERAQASTVPDRQSQIYHIAPGDKVQVTVFNEDKFSGEFQVDGRGQIAFPLIGRIRVGGATVTELQDQLVRRLRHGYVRDPRIVVSISDYRPFNVFGEVKNSGQYAFRPGMSVHDAIAMAGGFTYRANTHAAYLRHAAPGGEVAVNMDAERTPILPGDTIRVPERYF
jgi:polysaccharide biosynthesis/export protein